jgi:hypothetical protein
VWPVEILLKYLNIFNELIAIKVSDGGGDDDDDDNSINLFMCLTAANNNNSIQFKSLFLTC